ncbi:IgGFc-binding protein-like, partial [Hemiscyllium ocellatum]|uniref:IgGFc-binding protein-like n=1 Tax=Hemiscyllium ocellatum TaxID=170820 RepID=UPI0029665A53
VDEAVYGPECLELCTCYETGYVECQGARCPPSQSCLVRKGVRGCYTNEGVCSITQGRRLLTFDGHSAPIPGPGVYVLASVCNETAPGWFRALVQFRPCLEGGEPGLSALFLHFDSAFIAVTVDRNIWVNGRAVAWHQLPYRLLLDVTIRSEAGAVIVEHSSGVWLKLSADGELPVPVPVTVTVTVTVPESLRRQMCGTCGMFGAHHDGELLMPDGSVTADIPTFLTSWLAPEFTACLI